MIDYNDFLRFLDKSKSDWNTLYPAKYVVDNEHGFVVFDMDEDVLWVWQMYGDGRYWLEYLSNICRENGITKIRGTTKRNPLAWNKRLGTEVIGYIIEYKVENNASE